jgi:hypothetical protein
MVMTSPTASPFSLVTTFNDTGGHIAAGVVNTGDACTSRTTNIFVNLRKISKCHSWDTTREKMIYEETCGKKSCVTVSLMFLVVHKKFLCYVVM